MFGGYKSSKNSCATGMKGHNGFDGKSTPPVPSKEVRPDRTLPIVHPPLMSSSRNPAMRCFNTPTEPSGAEIPLEEVAPLYGGRRAALSLNIIVVGAGLGGLAATHTLAHAGHRVTLLESTRVLGEVGAGIQVSPNASRLLLRWGLGPALRTHAVEPSGIVFRRYDTGERLGYTNWSSRMERDHGAPYYQIHRADYHAMLHRLAATAPNVHIRLGATVCDVQPDPAVAGGPSITLESGEVLYADLIVGADGVKSRLQKVVTGLDDQPTPTGDAAYRAIVPTDLMAQDPELRPLIESAEGTIWMAPGRHLGGYCIVSAILRLLYQKI